MMKLFKIDRDRGIERDIKNLFLEIKRNRERDRDRDRERER